jgi:16S rRNA (adenine1518-N6/adenine1519-N6)-dimethyltransferase
MTRPRKRFGQHFLNDPTVIQQIVTAINPVHTDHILEIGPGRGAITGLLLDSGCHLDLVEIDRDLIDLLKRKYDKKVTIYSEDILKFDFARLARVTSPSVSQPRIRVVGNLPYNISTPLLFRLFQYGELIEDLTFMLQLEVVNRIIADPSTKSYGRLSIMSQYHCEAEKLFDVPPSAFTPVPKVQSALLRLRPHRNPGIKVRDIALLEQLLITAFSKRRKTVRNALISCLSGEELKQLNIDTSLRPENLTLADYVRCADYMADRPA